MGTMALRPSCSFSPIGGKQKTSLYSGRLQCHTVAASGLRFLMAALNILSHASCSFTSIRREPFGIGRSEPRPRLPIIRRLVRTRETQQNLHRCYSKMDSLAAVHTQSSTATQKAPAVEYEVSYRYEGAEIDNGGAEGKGWTDADGNLNQRLLAKFRALAVVAGDRVEMHNILANQRSNWNHLFHSTIVIAAVSAAASAAMNGAEPAIGLTLVATCLNFVCAGFMYLLNQQQPSQLAEEQRRAARFFKRLVVEVEATLQIDPQLREEASAYWKEKVGTLHALDGAFPLPLTPNGLEKFPKQVIPSELSSPLDQDDHNAQEGSSYQYATRYCSGWTQKTEEYIKETIMVLQTKDIQILLDFAKRAESLNLALAKTSPFLAIAAALCSIAHITRTIPIVPWLAAVFTVGALFTHSMSHALQLGSGFEMYRNHAGYYKEIQRIAERALELPVNMREDWMLFLGKINLQLGHDPTNETVQENCHRAGKLF